MSFDLSKGYPEYLQQMQEFQNRFIAFLDSEENIEENYENLIQLIPKSFFGSDEYEIKPILYIISKVSKNHHRYPNFTEKVTKILKNMKETMKNNFSNSEIFILFKSNRILLLFLIEEEILQINSFIFGQLTNKKSISKKKHQFFQPEIQKFIEKKKIEDQNENLNWIQNLPINFDKNRKTGENDNAICQLIRDDSIEKFTEFIKEKNVEINSQIELSIYETNSFLINKTPTLIEYAAFFGSSEVFKFLLQNGAELHSSLWLYGIHSDNNIIIHLIEEKGIQPEDKSFEKCMEEAIKCHHNELAFYIESKYLNETDKENNIANNFDNNVYSYSFHYYNFKFLPTELNDSFAFKYACLYDHLIVVKNILKKKRVEFDRLFVFLTKKFK